MTATRALLPVLLLPLALAAQRPVAQTGERQFSRVLVFSQVDGKFAIPCQYVIEYGAPEWKAQYDAYLAEAQVGTRLRVGKDAWTTFDTNRPLKIGGVDVAPGHYCVTAAKVGEKEYALVLLDSASVRAKQLDPFQSGITEGGLVIPLQWERVEKVADTLAIRFSTNQENAKEASLAIAFGPHRLSAPITASF
jgi:hypothetical protein